MRLLHPETLRIISTMCTDSDFTNATVSRKQVISHAWVEVLKYKATNQSHPKMFIKNDIYLGGYVRRVYEYGCKIGCNFNVENLCKYDELYVGFCDGMNFSIDKYFDRDYLFSDAVSLYLKGVNIFPYIFGDDANKYIPIINLKEVKRIVDKTLSKEKI